MELVSHLGISATGFCPDRSMSFDKDGGSALVGGKLTGNGKANCTGADYLVGEDTDQLKGSFAKLISIGLPTACVKSACCDLVVEKSRAAVLVAEGVVSSLKAMLWY